jgi:hypothetical protein
MAVGTNGPPVLNGSAYVYPEKTLAQLREQLLIRLGYGAMLATPPPGMEPTLDSFLTDAHEQLYHRYPTLRQQRWWTIAITQGNRFYDVPYTGAYLAGNDIAIINGTPDALNSISGDFTAGGFTTGMSINISGSDADDGIHAVGATVGVGTMELSTTTTVTGETAGNQIFVKEEGFVNLHLRQITYVGLLDGVTWNDMISGIKPTDFNNTSQQRPSHYEIREFVEFFPEPDKAYTLYIKGRTGLRPFGADTDVTSMDPHVVFLQSLAQAKAHYGQGDANIYFQQLENLLGNLNSESFGNDRFIPSQDMEVPPLPYPEVTGTGWSR